MSELTPHSRREALRRGAVLAGAIAAGGLLRPALASAQSTEDDDLRDFLAEATGLEQITVLAYATAAEEADAADRQLFADFRDQEQAHATALRTALDSLGFEPPDAPDSPEDEGVFDDIDGLDEDTATELKELLASLGEANGADSFLELLADLEQRQIAYYVAGTAELDSYDLATTAAEISGCQATHLVVLREQLGDDPADALTAVSKAILSAEPPADSSSDSEDSG